MKFNNMHEVQTALKVIAKKNEGKRFHYPVAFKKAVMEFINTNDYTVHTFATETGLNKATVYYWATQYKEKLYELDGAYCVSQKSKDINAAIVKKLDKEIAKIQRKLSLVKQCSAEGIKVG